MSLKIINLNFIKHLIIFILSISISKIAYCSENVILFKINEKAFTTLDYENRIKYLDFVSSSNNLSKEIVINDFISAQLFYEYFKEIKNKNNYDDKIKEIYTKVLKTNENNKKEYEFEIDKERILFNIKLDFIRKTILENILNSTFKNLDISNKDIDLLYEIKLKYLNINNETYNIIKSKLINLENIKIEVIKNFLNENNLEYFYKEEEINNINKVSMEIRENIIQNINFFTKEKNKNISLIFIEKSFETYDGIIVDLYSLKSNEIINENYLKCENLTKITNNENITNKEYNFINLNNELKNNLININDYVKFTDNEINFYVILCDIKFDKEKLNNVNLDKLINLNVDEIETRFINKYSKKYNLIKLYE